MLDQFERYRISDRYGAPEPSLFEFKKKPKKVPHRFNYTHLEADPQGMFVMPHLLSFGDYDNSSLVERSNYRVFKEEFAKLEDREWWEIGGSYGKGIVLRIDADERHEELREFFEALENYPLADESDHSELEMEEESKDWKDYGEDDLLREVQKYTPPHLEDAIQNALGEHTYDLVRAMGEAGGSYPEHNGQGTDFHHERNVWQSLAKATDEEWGQFLALLQDEKTDWNYRGNGFAFIKMLFERKLSQDELVALAWRKYGRDEFHRALLAGFRDTWVWYNSEKLTELQRESLERSLEQLRALSTPSLTFLFWSVLQPLWDAKNEHNASIINGYWNAPIRFETHWMTRYFVRWALTTEYAVFMDAVSEGSFDSAAQLIPYYAEFLAQQN